jgi:hypothetical protein
LFGVWQGDDCEVSAKGIPDSEKVRMRQILIKAQLIAKLSASECVRRRPVTRRTGERFFCGLVQPCESMDSSHNDIHDTPLAALRIHPTDR